MGKICVIGASATIAQGFIKTLPNDHEVITVGRSQKNDIVINLNTETYNEELKKIPLQCDYYLITLGSLLAKKINEQSTQETLDSVVINLIAPVKIIESLLETNKKARIIVLGSESGEKGSYDTSYFLSKAALHSYVREKHICYPEQQLVMIAPSVILDSNMTQSRHDFNHVVSNADKLPKHRYLYSQEIIDLIAYLFFTDKGYINNEVININGGKFARMKS